MASLKEIKDKEYFPNRVFIKMLTVGTFSLAKTLLTNLGDIRKLRESSPSEERYVRPKRKYEIPRYREGMKYCDSDEKYLRPTLYCNCRAPEIIALANKLGAFKKSDYEFAESAFEFAKRNLVLEILPMDDVSDTLRRGTGTCLHINSVFAALCRAAGIKARYRLFAAVESQSMYEEIYDSMMRRWYDALGYFSLEGEIEVYIDGKWLPAHAGPTPERQAAMGVPITKFGESSMGLWFKPIPGTMFVTESLPYGIGMITKALTLLAPKTVERINVNILKQIEKGRKILEEMGEENYDREARKKYRMMTPKITLERRKELIFDEG